MDTIRIMITMGMALGSMNPESLNPAFSCFISIVFDEGIFTKNPVTKLMPAKTRQKLKIMLKLEC